MKCARSGCNGRPLTAKARYCSARCASGWRKPNGIGHSTRPTKTDMPPKTSWWLKPETFYTEARKRFPEAGTAVVSRGKVRTAGPDAPGTRERLREIKARRKSA